MSITKQIRDYLLREGFATPDVIAESIPELNQCGGAERALLLLRLNPQFEYTGSKWITRGSGQSDEAAVLEAAEQYFRTIGRSGAPITNVVKDVSKATRLDGLKVEQILKESEEFTIMNTNIFNRPKRQEDR